MHESGDPRDAFLARMWDVLEPFAPRLHWGKLFPHEPASIVAGRFPRQADFLATRARLDPDGVFLSTWLRSALGVTGAPARPSAPLPRRRVPELRWRWPLWFSMRPASLATLGRADKVFDLSRVVAASPADAIAAFFDEATTSTVPGLDGFIWHTQAGDLDGAVVDEAFAFMTMRMRTVDYQHGVRLVMSVDRCTLPLGAELLQIFEAEPRAGGALVRWRIAVCLVPSLPSARPRCWRWPPVRARHGRGAAPLRAADLMAGPARARPARATCFLASCCAQLDALTNGALSCEALVTLALQRIEALNPALNAVVACDRDAALKAARGSDARYAAGTARPLEGLPITIKDAFEVMRLPGHLRQPPPRDARASTPTQPRWRACGRPGPSSSARPTSPSSRRTADRQRAARAHEQPVGRLAKPRRFVGRRGRRGGDRHEQLRAGLRRGGLDSLAVPGHGHLRPQVHAGPRAHARAHPAEPVVRRRARPWSPAHRRGRRRFAPRARGADRPAGGRVAGATRRLASRGGDAHERAAHRARRRRRRRARGRGAGA